VSNDWFVGHVKPFWDDYKDLAWINEPFNDQVTLEKWKSQGHNYAKYTGKLYDQRFEMPQWVDLAEEKLVGRYPGKAKHLGVAIYCMTPGTILPNHQDTYAKYKKLYNVTEDETVWRMLILMEDWQSGHYLEVDGEPFTKWQAGDYAVWKDDTVHMAANLGNTDRYTLQVTATI